MVSVDFDFEEGAKDCTIPVPALYYYLLERSNDLLRRPGDQTPDPSKNIVGLLGSLPGQAILPSHLFQVPTDSMLHVLSGPAPHRATETCPHRTSKPAIARGSTCMRGLTSSPGICHLSRAAAPGRRSDS